MNFWEKVTGSDITKAMNGFAARAAALPPAHRQAWAEISDCLAPYTDFTGRNLLPILDSALALLEITAADGQPVAEVLGGDVAGFCAALATAEGAQSARDRWRAQLNRNVAKKLEELP